MENNVVTQEDGEYLVKLARKTIVKWLTERKKLHVESRLPKGGAFVTLNKIENGKKVLRGCIGYIKSDRPLDETVIDAAIAAATEDPRFPPVTPAEMKDIVIEVTVLSPPELLEVPAEKRPEAIVVGKHGLIIERGFWSGLLLPQVPVEYNWNSIEFLQHTCLKAGLEPNCWKDPKTRVYTFTGEVYGEESPEGPIHREM